MLPIHALASPYGFVNGGRLPKYISKFFREIIGVSEFKINEILRPKVVENSSRPRGDDGLALR
jgi:hypothetical protein